MLDNITKTKLHFFKNDPVVSGLKFSLYSSFLIGVLYVMQY